MRFLARNFQKKKFPSLLPPDRSAPMPLSLFVVNSSNGQSLYLDVHLADQELRPQMPEGAAAAKGPYTSTKPDEEQLVGYFDECDPNGLGYAVFLFAQKHASPSFERLNIPAQTKRAVIHFDGSREHVRLYKDKAASQPRWMRWVYLVLALLVVACFVALVAYKSFARKKQRHDDGSGGLY
jgi:hypothetical protein